MGLSHSWIAVKGMKRPELLAALRLEEGDELEPEEFAPFSLGRLRGGWLLLITDHFEYASPARVAALSQGGQAVGCAEEEHVMASRAVACMAGAETWRVTHDADKGVEHLEVLGQAPPAIEQFRADMLRKQAKDDQVDYVYDVPVMLAEATCGYRLGKAAPKLVELQKVGRDGFERSRWEQRGGGPVDRSSFMFRLGRLIGSAFR